jgi:histidine triad (HIT) family protein
MTTQTPTDCPFCRANGLLRGEVVAETEDAFLLKGEFGRGTHLIIPSNHYENLVDLPNNWWAEMKALLPQIPDLATDYNLALNYGKAAGQSVKHLHFWIIPRETNKPSSGKGLATFIKEADTPA